MPTTAPSGLRSARQVRSLPSRMKSVQQLEARHLQRYMQEVTKINLPFTLGSLEDKKKHSIKEMERVCQDHLGPNQPAQCMSAQFVDSEGQPVLFYFGDRIWLAEGESPVSKFFA
jgi:hypothetical protein